MKIFSVRIERFLSFKFLSLELQYLKPHLCKISSPETRELGNHVTVNSYIFGYVTYGNITCEAQHNYEIEFELLKTEILLEY